MISLANLNPYVIYFKIGIVVLIIIGLFWLGWHEMGIRADLKSKSVEAEMWKMTTTQYAQEFQKYIDMNREITNAVKAIKVQSNNYIQSVESSPAPVVADGGTVVLMHPEQALSVSSSYRNNSSSRTSASVAGSRSDKAGN